MKLINGSAPPAPSQSSRRLQAALGGDVDAFMDLMDEHKPALRSMVYATVNDAHLTDDVMQDTYLKAYRSLASFNSKSSFKTWIYRIAHNAAIDLIRRRSVAPMAQSSLVGDEASSGQALDEAVTDRTELLDALAQLNEQQRAVIVLIDAHGFSYSDAADALNLSTGGVSFHLKRARVALAEHLSNPKEGTR